MTFFCCVPLIRRIMPLIKINAINESIDAIDYYRFYWPLAAGILSLVRCGSPIVGQLASCGTNLIGQPASQQPASQPKTTCFLTIKLVGQSGHFWASFWTSMGPRNTLFLNKFYSIYVLLRPRITLFLNKLDLWFFLVDSRYILSSITIDMITSLSIVPV